MVLLTETEIPSARVTRLSANQPNTMFAEMSINTTHTPAMTRLMNAFAVFDTFFPPFGI